MRERFNKFMILLLKLDVSTTKSCYFRSEKNVFHLIIPQNHEIARFDRMMIEASQKFIDSFVLQGQP